MFSSIDTWLDDELGDDDLAYCLVLTPVSAPCYAIPGLSASFCMHCVVMFSSSSNIIVFTLKLGLFRWKKYTITYNASFTRLGTFELFSRKILHLS